MAIAKSPHTSSHASIDRLRRVRHPHNRPSSALSALRLPPLQQHLSMFTSLHLPIPYATHYFSSGPHQAAGGTLPQPCKGLSKITLETDYRLLRSPRVVAMAVTPTTAALSHSVKTADVDKPLIEVPISIYDLAQSRRWFYLRSSFSPSSSPFPLPSPSHSPSLVRPCPCFNNKNYKSMHAENYSLDDVRRTRRCQGDRLWLNPDAPQVRQPLLDCPFDDYQSIQWMIVNVEDLVEEDKARYLELALEEMAMALDKPLLLRSRLGIDWCLSSSAIVIFDRTNSAKGDRYTPCIYAAVAASDVTPDSCTTYASAVARFKHDDNDSNGESSVFGLGAPSLPSSSSSVIARPPCCHTCTATPTTTLSPLPYASTVTPSSPLPPFPSSSATQFLDPSSFSATSSLDTNLRSPSREQPNRSTTIDEANSSPFTLSPPTSTPLASMPSSSTSSTTTTAITTARIFNLNDCEGSLNAPVNSVTTSSTALIYSSSTNSSTFTNTIITPAQQFLTDSEQHRHYLLHHYPSTYSPMGRFNPAGSTPESLSSSSSSSSFSASSVIMSAFSSSCPHGLQEFSSPPRISLDHNDEPASENCHHVNQHQEQDGSSDMASTDEMRLREQIVARISPRATMMSRTPPALPEVPVWDEPVAHQIRRVQSAHMAELRRQWEDLQQQRRQTQVQEQQPLQQHQRHTSYPPIQRSVSMSRFAPVAMERTSPVVMQRSMPTSSAATAEAQLQRDKEIHLRTMTRGSNSLYLNYEGGILRPEEQWRRGQDDMVGR